MSQLTTICPSIAVDDGFHLVIAYPASSIHNRSMRFSNLFILLASSHAVSYVAAQTVDPAPPELEFLYTAFCDCAAPIEVGPGPKGGRKVIPIIGGNFTGPRLQGRWLL